MKKMKNAEKFLLNSCALSVLITSLFLIFYKINTPQIAPAIDMNRHFTILIFSFITVGANQLLSMPRIPKILAVAIHYVVTLIASLFIFTDISSLNATNLFISITIFTIFYAVFFGLVIAIKKLCYGIDKTVSKSSKPDRPKEAYKPRYK